MGYFNLSGSEHTIDDIRCCECYRGYPTKCVCGGLIHAQFIKETWENEVILNFSCDICGDNFNFPGQRGKRRKFKRKYH